MAASYDQISVGVNPGYHTFPLRPGSSGLSLSGFGGAQGASAPVFEPQNPYTVPSSNGFYDSGADSSLTPAVSSVCVVVKDVCFPDGQQGYMFPKGTVVTVTKKQERLRRGSKLRPHNECVYEALFYMGDRELRMKVPSQEPINAIREKIYNFTVSNTSFSEDIYNLALDPERNTALDEENYNAGFYTDIETLGCEQEDLIPLGVLAEAIYVTKGVEVVAPIAVKGVCEVALNADFSDPKRILPKPGQELYLTTYGAIDQGQRSILHLALICQKNMHWLNALRIKVVVAPSATDTTVLALLG